MNERQITRTVINRITAARGLPTPWPDANAELPDWLATADVTGWGVVQLGEMRLRLADPRQRDKHGQVYTPPEVVDFQVRATLDLQLPKLAHEPRPLEHLLIHDPFCGPGIFLIHTARHLAAWLLDRAHLPATPANVRWAAAEALINCVYGSDLDEVAVDIARAVCWLEVGSPRVPITFMDDNIAVCDTFNDELPPGLAKRWPIERTPAAVAGHAEPPSPQPNSGRTA